MPGVPMLFAGDELGLEGAWGEDARRTMPWSHEGSWDRAFLDEVRALVALATHARRRSRTAGCAYVHASDDVLVYLRETREERLLVPRSASAAHTRLDTLYRPGDALRRGRCQRRAPGRRPRIPYLEDSS